MLSATDVIDLVEIDDKNLYRLYCQLKEIDEYGLMRSFEKLGNSYDVLETLEFPPITINDSDRSLLETYTSNVSVPLIDYVEKLGFSSKLLLEKLLDFVFGKSEKLPNFGRLMREFGVSLSQVNEVKDFLSNTAPTCVKELFIKINLLPMDLEIIFAILFSCIDEHTLKQQFEEFAHAESVVTLTEQEMQEIMKEIETMTKPVEEAAESERLEIEKTLMDLRSNSDNAELTLSELEADIKKMKATVDMLSSKELENLKSMCATERCTIDETTPGEVYVPPKKQQKVGNSLNGNSQWMNDAAMSSGADIEPVRKVHRKVPLAPSMPSNLMPTLRVNDPCLATNGMTVTWSDASVMKITQNDFFVKFQKTGFSTAVKKTCVAFTTPPTYLLPVGCRVVAAFLSYKDNVQSGWVGGIVGEQPVEGRNGYRYLIFFDNAETQYVAYQNLRRIYGPSSPGYLDITNQQVKEFVMNYVKNYPERAVVRLKLNEIVKVEYQGVWMRTRVSDVDCMMVCVCFEDNHFEWLYRGDKRLQPIHLQDINRSLNIRSGRRCRRVNRQLNAVVEFLSDDENVDDESDDYDFESSSQLGSTSNKFQVARKSTASRPSPKSQKPCETQPQTFTDLDYDIVEESLDANIARVAFSVHRCTPFCLTREDDPEAFKGSNPLIIPMRYDWDRLVMLRQSKYGQSKRIVYWAPCGIKLRSMVEVAEYLSAVDSKLTIDLFCFDPRVNPFNRCVVKKPLYFDSDMSNGNEKVPIECVNCVSNEAPSKMNYQARRYTDDRNVDLALAQEFLSGCNCSDNCSVKSACACQLLTIRQTKHPSDYKVGYENRCLPNGLIETGIFECNSLCKCNERCANRVVQSDLSRVLQLFKTKNRGWGVRTLYDIPKGGFVAIYAGNVLSDMKANEVGKIQGDEYFAELDLINHCESNKEGYEEEVVGSDEEDNFIDSNDSNADSDQDDGAASRRRRRKQSTEVRKLDSTGSTEDEHVVMLTDETSKSVKSKIRPSVDRNQDFNGWRMSQYIGEDKVYTLDAKVSGNIGRYLNHSCSPNVFVQNVFVDTHDLSLPWVAFFASERIHAGSELCWDYSYTVDSVAGKQLKCYCGSANCRRRLL